MTALTVAVVLLWIAVIALGILFFALARQIGVLHERVTPAGAMMMKSGPKVGEAAPVITVADIEGQELSIGGRRDDERHVLLFFLSPTCPVCKTLIPSLRSARKSEADWLDIVLAGDGDMEEQLDFVQREDLREFRYVVSSALGISFQIGKLPYAVLIDGDGVLTTGGLVNSREHLDSIFTAKELDVASVQEFLARDATRDNAA